MELLLCGACAVCSQRCRCRCRCCATATATATVPAPAALRRCQLQHRICQPLIVCSTIVKVQ
jgi:hypothetical protein